MVHPNLRSYIDTLSREGELHIIDELVDPYLELAEIQRCAVARQGPALLFTRVARTQFPVITNLFGTRRRIELAFGNNPTRFIKRLAEAAETLIPPSLSGIWNFRDLAKDVFRMGTRNCSFGPVLDQAMAPPQLTSLPQIQCWPKDGGAFLTLPLIYTEHPITGKANLGMYRNQIFDDLSAGMHFQIHRGGGFHYHEAEKLGKALPANLFLGGPPALIMAAIAPLPENMPELMLASLLQEGKISCIRDTKLSQLPIIAETEFALVGSIPPRIRRMEGPFGDHYGYYSLAHEFPIFKVEKIFHRKNAIFPATVVGRPRQEDHYIGEYLQELFSPIYPLVMNGVVDVWAYDDAGMHTLASAVVRERYRKEAFMAALRILGEGQLSLTKFLMVTDTRLQLRQFRSLLIHILERADFATDLFIFSNISQDTLDYSSRTLNEGSKAILMGLGEKRYHLESDIKSELRNPIYRQQKVFAPGVLVIEGPSWRQNDSAVAELLEEDAVKPFRLICLVDNASECVRDEASFLWTVFTRFEPAADIHALESRIAHNHIQLSAPILLDCRIKPWYPPPVDPLPETVARVDALWNKLLPKK
jgi:UbiD family decarboxylase